jgi:hypothetical protein
MGYQRSVLRLKFKDPQFEGLEVTMRRMSIGQLQTTSKLTKDSTDEKFDELVNRIAKSIIAWNVEDPVSGEPINSDTAGVKEQDPEMVLAIANAWLEAAAGISGPLTKPSSDGENSKNSSEDGTSLTDSIVASIPMEILQPSPAG